MLHGLGEPSDWVKRWAHLAAPGATVLDLACGGGRHLRWWAARGHMVTGVDRDAEALAGLKGLGELILADIENEAWPLASRQFGVVVVTNYLWRPLLPAIVARRPAAVRNLCRRPCGLRAPFPPRLSSPAR